ncbi:MAG TPA: zf-HC2 domain-containing protein [Oligoflexia bacterium]|nr:zf-HC2 domain-containing protein [Oligoflexia bacterium]HMP27893.1 zf-HC2 domain-containing protein [Oligoflexia bacterium]
MNGYSDLHLRILERESFGCHEFETLLSDYFDGELPRTLRALADDHLKKCPNCRSAHLLFALVLLGARDLRHHILCQEDQFLYSEQTRQPEVGGEQFTAQQRIRLRAILNSRLRINLPLT